MAGINFKIGEQYHHLIVNGKKYQAGTLDYEIENGVLTIWKQNSSKTSPIGRASIAEVVDGDADAPFADQAAIENWIASNFFF